jgi:CheY-like chemotaxis protein
LTDRPRILIICDSPEQADRAMGASREECELVVVSDAAEALSLLERESFDRVVLDSPVLPNALRFGRILQNEQILDSMADAVALLAGDHVVVWGNRRLREWSGRESVEGASFYALLGSPDILGPDYCPFHTALATGCPSVTKLRLRDGRYLQLNVAPAHHAGGGAKYLVATARDVTWETQQQQKLAAIHRAGMELANLIPNDLAAMPVEGRVDLLKANILHFTRDLLKYDVVEVRLLDQKTGRLEPLLSEGMEADAAARELFAQPQGNGVTGFVAATGKSYLCEDTLEDPLYLSGAKNAKSSITVPLVLHDEVIGTFNVESPEPRAFHEGDLQFLEIFSRDVAVALNTLELLVAENARTAAASIEAIHSAVALPVDEILNEAVNVMERYIGHEPEVVDQLQRILRNARDIKQVIQAVGQKMAPAPAHPPQTPQDRSELWGRQILLVDEDAAVRSIAHGLLERYGCNVETAPNGSQAMFMIRSMVRQGGYDAIIADIRLPDMNGYQFLVKLREVVDSEPLPLILMTGFGYDPGHSLVKARQAGVRDVLYKPFRLDVLLETIKRVVAAHRGSVAAS